MRFVSSIRADKSFKLLDVIATPIGLSVGSATWLVLIGMCTAGCAGILGADFGDYRVQSEDASIGTKGSGGQGGGRSGGGGISGDGGSVGHSGGSNGKGGFGTGGTPGNGGSLSGSGGSSGTSGTGGGASGVGGLGAGGLPPTGGFIGAGGTLGTGGAGGGCAGPTTVRLVEVFEGFYDHVILENTSATCPADLGGIGLAFGYNGIFPGSFEMMLSPRLLSPHERVILTEDTSRTNDIVLNQSLPWASNGSSGAVLLCSGACSAAVTNVVDAVRFTPLGIPDTSLPFPISFTPLQTMVQEQEEQNAFVRLAFAGAYPAFLASDWGIGPTTRTSCPPTLPAQSSTCTLNIVCVYGGTTCQCPSGKWTCS